MGSNNHPYIKLKKVCSVNQGLQFPISKRHLEDGSNRYFYITVQFLKDGFKKKYFIENPSKSTICDENDILVVRTGNTGQIITGVKGCFHNNFFKINYDKTKVEGKYLYYCLITKEKYSEMQKRAGLTTIPDLNHFMFLDMKIPLPNEISIQKKIVNVLLTIDNKISLNNKINEELEQIARMLFGYWFVQFDFPNKEGKPYKTSGGEMEYNEVLKREIPKGWEVENIASSKITRIIDTGIDEYIGTKIYLSTSEVKETEIINHTITESFKNRPSRANIQPITNSIWFARMKDSKKIILISDFSKEIANDYIFSTGFAGLKVHDFSLYYIWNFINSNYFEKMKNLNATGSTQKAIINESIENIPLLIPTKKVLEEYNSKLKHLYAMIYKNQRQNLELTHLREFLLPLLINGQVKVN